LNNSKRKDVIAFAKSCGLTGTIKLGDVLALFPHEA
jgi:hypothetical protein